jgi:predicted secreted protein
MAETLNTPALPDSTINRRAMLLGASAIAVAQPALAALPSPDAQLLRLFRQWHEVHLFFERCCKSGEDPSDDEENAFVSASSAIEQQIVALPAESAAGLAVKMIIANDCGKGPEDAEYAPELAAWSVLFDLYRMLGVSDRSGLAELASA